MATLAKLLVEIGVKLDGELKVESKLKAMRTSAERLGAAGEKGTTRFRAALASLGNAAQGIAGKVTSSLDSMVVSAGGLGAVAAAAGAAFVAAGYGAFKFIDAQAEAIGAIEDMSVALGVDIEQLQRLQYAATQTGVSHDVLSKGIKNLNSSMLAMKDGATVPAKDALDKLGISLQSLQGRDAQEQLGLIGDRLRGVTGDAERAALAGEIFGKKAGPEMLLLLREGSTGINELAAAAQGVFSLEDAQRAAEFSDTINEIKGEITGLARGLAVDLLPMATEVVTAIREWVAENRVWLGQKLEEAARGIGAGFKVAAAGASALADVVAPLGKLLGALGITMGRFEKLMTFVQIGIYGVAAALKILADPTADVGKVFDDMIAKARKAKDAFEAAAKSGGGSQTLTKMAGTTDLSGHIGNPLLGADSTASGAFGAGGAGVGGGSSGQAGEKPPITGITGDELIAALLAGHTGALGEQLRGVSVSLPDTKEIKPQAVVTLITQNFDSVYHVRSTDPRAIGAEVTNHQRRDLSRAAQSLAENTVR